MMMPPDVNVTLGILWGKNVNINRIIMYTSTGVNNLTCLIDGTAGRLQEYRTIEDPLQNCLKVKINDDIEV